MKQIMNNGKWKMKNEGLKNTDFLIFKFFFFSFALLMFVSGCATAGKGQMAAQGYQNPVLASIKVTDNKLDIVVDKPFTYTIYKSSDPYKVIVELPDVRLGAVPNKIKSDKVGITEITSTQVEEPLSVRLEILLSSPVSVEPVYKDTSLAIKVKEEPEVKGAEIATEVPRAEEKGQAVQEVKATAEKSEEKLKEVKWAEVEKPEQKAAIPTEEVKEEAVALAAGQKAVVPAEVEGKEKPAVPQIEPGVTTIAEVKEPEPKAAVPKEFPPATSIVSVKIEKEQDFLKVLIRGNGSLSPKVFRLDNRAILDIPNVAMEAALPASIPPPLKSIRAGKHKDKTRLVLDMKEGTSFDVAAIEDSVIVSFRIPERERYVAKVVEKAAETKAAVVAQEKPVEGRYKGQKISLDFQAADIGPIFRLLADISGYNFVIDPSVSGKITMKLMNVPWDQALDIILQTFNLGKSIEGNIIWIAPTSMFTKIAEERTKAKVVEEIAEELKQEIVRINYANAGEIRGAIDQGKLLSSRGSITIDSRMNTLIIKDTQTSIGKIKELVKIMDVAKPQVLIEAKIVEVSSNYSESLGIKWGGSFYASTWPTSLSGDFSVNTPTASAGSGTTNPGGALALTLGNASTLNVNLSLSALESIGKSKRLSNPKILTMDNEGATIQQGTSIPVQTTSAEGTKTEYVNATLSLNVTPRITPEGYIQLKIAATNNALGILTPQGYAIDTKSVNTQALVKSGDTLVIGGIYTTSTIEGTEGFPLLSKIPFLGWLFKTKTQTGPNVTELLIFITPIVVSRPL